VTIEKAQQIWDCAEPACNSHPFFVRWHITAPSVRIDRSGAFLMVPMRDAALNLQNLAYIDVERNPHYLLAGDVSGLYYGLNGRKEAIAIAHEFVTGVRFRELTAHAVAIAFCAENVLPVAKAIQEKYPSARIFLIEDPDVGMDRKPAVACGEAAAAIVDQPVALPEFDRGNALKPGSDAQKLLDWIRRKGLTEFTRKQVMQLGPSSIRDATSAKEALLTLVEMGWIVTADGTRYRTPPDLESAIPEETTCSA
jgi:phage/plasmid primase-like uncharacterized protein